MPRRADRSRPARRSRSHQCARRGDFVSTLREMAEALQAADDAQLMITREGCFVREQRRGDDIEIELETAFPSERAEAIRESALRAERYNPGRIWPGV